MDKIKLPTPMYEYVQSITDPHKKSWTIEALDILIDTMGYPESMNSSEYASAFIDGFVEARSIDYFNSKTI